jgi:hypothetical protein
MNIITKIFGKIGNTLVSKIVYWLMVSSVSVLIIMIWTLTDLTGAFVIGFLANTVVTLVLIGYPRALYHRFFLKEKKE